MEKDNGKVGSRRQYRERTTDSVRKEDLRRKSGFVNAGAGTGAAEETAASEKDDPDSYGVAAVVIITAAVRGIAGHFSSSKPSASGTDKETTADRLPGETRQSRKPPAAKVHRKIHSKLLN